MDSEPGQEARPGHQVPGGRIPAPDALIEAAPSGRSAGSKQAMIDAAMDKITADFADALRRLGD